ncbi:helix-turn-helix domain-containing protein [Mesorhizobium sp. LCM 4576]|uniref:helix-turn-helix domain-containing protein n=1 Tax=Mesorhizobium sp. LCM 4576 TaxID=1848289 RepID=UPI0012FF9A22|nr:helix-turn-helix domain-containing protein [Mesorhizobium sp. LCM 4576]
MTKLSVGAVKEALSKFGGNKAHAAHELQVARGTLYAFIDRTPELQAFACEIGQDIALANCLPIALRRGEVSAEDREQLRNLLCRCLKTEARAA